MIKRRKYLLITLLILTCLFTGCKNEMDNTESSQSNDKQTEVNDEQKQETDNTETNSEKSEVNRYGNSIGNLNEYGLITKQGEWIYYNDSGYLMRAMVDESGRKVIDECNTYYMNVVDEWIYCTENNRLCKKKIDGSETINLSDKYVNYVYVEDEWIYYKVDEDDMSVLYRMRLDGSDNRKIFDEAYCVYQGRIYYQYETQNSEYQLRSVSIDGSDDIVLVDGRIRYLNVDSDWIYYRGDDEGYYLYRMKVDGTEKVQLTDTEVSNIIVWDEWIYYLSDNVRDNSKRDMIYRMKTDGTNIQYASGTGNVNYFNVVDGRIAYEHSGNHKRYYNTFEEIGFVDLAQ